MLLLTPCFLFHTFRVYFQHKVSLWEAREWTVTEKHKITLNHIICSTSYTNLVFLCEEAFGQMIEWKGEKKAQHLSYTLSKTCHIHLYIKISLFMYHFWISTSPHCSISPLEGSSEMEVLFCHCITLKPVACLLVPQISARPSVRHDRGSTLCLSGKFHSFLWLLIVRLLHMDVASSGKGGFCRAGNQGLVNRHTNRWVFWCWKLHHNIHLKPTEATAGAFNFISHRSDLLAEQL